MRKTSLHLLIFTTLLCVGSISEGYSGGAGLEVLPPEDEILETPGDRTMSLNTIILERLDGDRAAFETIQEAIDQANAGDKILLSDGVYAENLRFVRSGTPESPISLEAFQGSMPIVDGAEPSLQKPEGRPWKQHSEFPDIYFAEVPYEGTDKEKAICTYVSRYGVPSIHPCDQLLSPYSSLDALRESSRGEGSFRDDSMVYVKLDGDQNPNEVGLSVGRARGVIDTMGHSNLRISGITVRNGAWSGICLPGSNFENIQIKDVTVENCFRGITITEAKSTTNLTIDSCKIFNGFDRSWTRNGGYVAGIGAHPDKRWSDPLSPFRGFGIRASGWNIEIADCHIAGNWDGIGIRGHHIKIHHNTMYHFLDDAIELESDRSSEVQVYNNHIYDAYTALSITPSSPGPFYIYRNLVETSRRDPERLNSGFAVKSGVNYSESPVKNVKIYNNSFYSNLFNVWEKMDDSRDNDWEGYDFVNNVFYARNQNVTFRGLSELDSGPSNFWSHNMYNLNPALPEGEEPGAIFSDDDSDFYIEIPDIDDTEPNNLHLTQASPARDSGSRYPVEQGWPDSIQQYPGGINRGAWEEGMEDTAIGTREGK